MLNFWEAKVRNINIIKYGLVPFKEEASGLLLAASRIWHPWAQKCSKDLVNISVVLASEAELTRKSGLGWACNISAFGQDPAGLLSTSSFYLYRRNEVTSPCPEASQFMASLALQLLFLLVPTTKKIDASSCNEKNSTLLYEKIEALSESPCTRGNTKIPIEVLMSVCRHAVFLECEGLTYMLAKIEDAYCHLAQKRKHKKSELSEQDLAKLAAEIGMPFNAVKEVFETEYSSWWKEAAKYEELAKIEEEKIFGLLEPAELAQPIRQAWERGMPSQTVEPKFVSEQELIKSEQVVKALISLLLSSVGFSGSKNLLVLSQDPKKLPK